MPLALLIVLTALPLHADPLLLPWGGDGASMAAGGSHAPAPLLGEVAPDAPTSLALADRPRVTAELTSTVPVSYIHGRRRFADLRVTDRDLSAAIPLADAESESRWWLGCMTARGAMAHAPRWRSPGGMDHGRWARRGMRPISRAQRPDTVSRTSCTCAAGMSGWSSAGTAA